MTTTMEDALDLAGVQISHIQHELNKIESMVEQIGQQAAAGRQEKVGQLVVAVCARLRQAAGIVDTSEVTQYRQEKAQGISALRRQQTALDRRNTQLLEALREDREKWSFDTLLYVAKRMLKELYPNPWPENMGPDDPGPRLVAAVRDCIAARGRNGA